MTEQIVLVSSDGVKFTTSIKISQLSGFILRIIQDYNPNEEIDLKTVSSKTLQRIIEFCAHHDFIAPLPPKKPIVSKDLKENLSDEWDAALISSLSDEDLLELILASNYLDMKCLLDACLVKYACTFKEMTIDEAKTRYNIEEDFTPEIEERLKQEYHWALEVDSEES
jgi:S-phase kinase-associated protein 1